MEQIKTELTQAQSTSLETLIPPYDKDDQIGIKLDKAYRAMLRSLRLRNRSLALTNAYFLGLLFNSPTFETRKFRKEISEYYYRMANYVYDLFETDPSLMMSTTTITVQQIVKLKRKEILQLREIVQDLQFQSIFDGAQNLEEEDC